MVAVRNQLSGPAPELGEHELDQYSKDFGAFIEQATNGELPKDAVAESLLRDVGDLSGAGEAEIIDPQSTTP